MSKKIMAALIALQGAKLIYFGLNGFRGYFKMIEMAKYMSIIKEGNDKNWKYYRSHVFNDKTIYVDPLEDIIWLYEDAERESAK